MNTKTTNNTNNRSNDFYINALKTQSNAGIETIYQDHFDLIKNMIIKLGGSEFEARDLFQEALIVIYQKVQSDTLNLTCGFRTYLFSICRNLWLKMLRNSGRAVSMEDLTQVPMDFMDDENQSILSQRKSLLAQKLELLAKDEKKVLKLFFEGVKMKEIARIMGYASEGYAKKKKNVCKNKLVALIQNDAMFGELAF